VGQLERRHLHPVPLWVDVPFANPALEAVERRVDVIAAGEYDSVALGNQFERIFQVGALPGRH